MMNFFSSCLFSHASDPVLVIVKGVTRWECRRCQADLGVVLPKQKLKLRKPAATLAKVSKFERSA